MKKGSQKHVLTFMHQIKVVTEIKNPFHVVSTWMLPDLGMLSSDSVGCHYFGSITFLSDYWRNIRLVPSITDGALPTSFFLALTLHPLSGLRNNIGMNYSMFRCFPHYLVPFPLLRTFPSGYPDNIGIAPPNNR